MAQDYYSPSDAERLIGVSRPAVRVYATKYGRWLSTEATPAPGAARRFRADDLRVLAFVYRKSTQENQTHDQIMATLEEFNGVPGDFDWRLPGEDSAEASAGAGPESTALVPLADLRAVQALMQDARSRESVAADQVATLQAEVQRLSLELGEARGALGVYQGRKRPKWLVWLMGE